MFAIVCEWPDGTVDVNGPYATEEIAILAARHIANRSFPGVSYWTEDGAKVYPDGTTPKEMVDHAVDPDVEMYVRKMGDPVEKPDTEESVGQLAHWKDEA